MFGFGVRLSKVVEDELRLQPHHVREEFRAACDRLEHLAASHDGPAQLRLPGFPTEYDLPRTWSFGWKGTLVFQIADGCAPEVLDVRWPNEIDDDTPEGRPPREL